MKENGEDLINFIWMFLTMEGKGFEGIWRDILLFQTVVCVCVCIYIMLLIWSESRNPNMITHTSV